MTDLADRTTEVIVPAPEGAFDRITALVARILGAPVAIVGLVDGDSLRLRSAHGLPGVTAVERDLELAADRLGLHLCAGAPLTTPEGGDLGMLAVLDREPRELTAAERATLRDLAALVIDELEAERLADALQASLLPPRTAALPGMDLATRYLAGQRGLKVGGDFFDVFRLAANDWGIVLGDACGKGARPASLAALARWTARASAVHQFHPSDVLRDVNAVLVADNEAGHDDHYCSLVLGRLQLDTCGAWLTVANAGHPLPVLVRRSGKVELRGQPALPAGLFEAIDPIDDRVGLGPGDALVFYTDGITEARDESGEVFGEERLVDELVGLTGRTAAEIADGIIGAAGRFSGARLRDDVAVVVVRVPDDAGEEPLARVSAATGVPADELELPGYPHG